MKGSKQIISSPSESSDEQPAGGSSGLPQDGSSASTETATIRSSYEVKTVREEPVPDIPMTEPVQDIPKAEPMVPQRVPDALKGSKSFAEFKAKRTFNFLHLFCGKNDVLSKAITRMANLEGMKVECYGIDTELDQRFDLLQDLPYNDILGDARGGKFDAGHGGPPCGSFSMARWKVGTGPPPVRSSQFIYGLPTNSIKQQQEADAGTLLFCRTTQIIGETIQAQRLRKVPEVGTVENPPGDPDSGKGSAWGLPEVQIFLKKFSCGTSRFNTCAYQKKSLRRWFKPARFSGRLDGLEKLDRVCSCPTGFKHQSLVGKDRTAPAAEYPEELCLEYAKLVIRAFRTVLNLEWWRAQEKIMKVTLTEAQRNWVLNKEKKAVA